MGSAQPPPPTRAFGGQEYDVAIIGAGPVGLALAIETARAGMSTLVVDRRPPLAEDTRVRPQLLVARRGDLAHLVHLGVDVRDPRIVSLLETRCEGDHASGRIVRGDVVTLRGEPQRARDLWSLAAQPPFALVPIGRLQQTLLERALAHGAVVHYGCDVTRVRRHARFASLTCADQTSARAAMIIIATGAARPLINSVLPSNGGVEGRVQRLIAGMFDTAEQRTRGQWIRVELPVRGYTQAARCTILQTPTEAKAGTAVLVAPQVTGTPTEEQLQECYDAAAHAYGLAGQRPVAAPMTFDTSVTTMSKRYAAGDGRAPVVIAGDAAQTGHVFSGQTAFVNIALALGLGERLTTVQDAVKERNVNHEGLVNALAHYDGQSEIGSAILARISQRHYNLHRAGAWAHAGIARAD
jgi:2-polyprenyl-6-methoxyphenol hydroxylase-like FAD-dependent oxidoreductase